MDSADLRNRYGVRTSAELVAKIEHGEAHSHPTWEESIQWQSLKAYIERLDR